MVQKPVDNITVCVVGLGYVGYPLAEAFSHHYTTIGYDVDERKIAQLKADGTPVDVTTDPARIAEADMISICVPTPVTKAKDPDLFFVKSASETVGKHMKHGAVVVMESTVYPGLTEEVMLPILEKESGMKCGVDFAIGYSPERINPGDDAHTLDKINKVVSGMDEETTAFVAEVYRKITNVFVAKNIKTAEAAKVIENTQRDLNIALMNELSMIFARMNLDTSEVLAAAGTKWNFHQYRPGLVGGHCIPVDPYYLVQKANEVGYHSKVITAGRSVNDNMPAYVAQMTVKGMIAAGMVIKGAKVLIMGLTYKENVPDVRESPVEAMVAELKEYGVEVYGYDPLLPDAVIEKFGAVPVAQFSEISADAIIISVMHDQFKLLKFSDLPFSTALFVMDVTGYYSHNVDPSEIKFRYEKL